MSEHKIIKGLQEAVEHAKREVPDSIVQHLRARSDDVLCQEAAGVIEDLLWHIQTRPYAQLQAGCSVCHRSAFNYSVCTHPECPVRLSYTTVF